MCEVETRNQNEAVGGGYFSKALISQVQKDHFGKERKKTYKSPRQSWWKFVRRWCRLAARSKKKETIKLIKFFTYILCFFQGYSWSSNFVWEVQNIGLFLSDWPLMNWDGQKITAALVSCSCGACEAFIVHDFISMHIVVTLRSVGIHGQKRRIQDACFVLTMHTKLMPSSWCIP